MRHSIWVFTACESTCLGVSRIQRVNWTEHYVADDETYADRVNLQV